MIVWKVGKWLLIVLAAVAIIFAAANWLGFNPFPTTKGETAIAAVGQRETTLTPEYFECHIYGSSRFIQSGFRDEDTTSVGAFGFDVDIGHKDYMAAFLGVVGEYELCVFPEDQTIRRVDDTVEVTVHAIRVNRPALNLGEPNRQEVPGCVDVIDGNGELKPGLVSADPSTYEQTHWLCVGKGLTAQTDDYTTFLQTLQRYAAWNVAESTCLDEAIRNIKRTIRRHYTVEIRRLGLEAVIDLNNASVELDRPEQPPVVERTTFAKAGGKENCVYES